MKIHTRVPLSHVNNFQSGFEQTNYNYYVKPAQEFPESMAEFLHCQDNTSIDLNPEPGVVEVDKASVREWVAQERKKKKDKLFAFYTTHITGGLDERDGRRKLRRQALADRGKGRYGEQSYGVVDPKVAITESDKETVYESKNGTLRLDKEAQNLEFLVPDDFDPSNTHWQYVNNQRVSRPAGRESWISRGELTSEQMLLDKYTEPAAKLASGVMKSVDDSVAYYQKLDNQPGDGNPDRGVVVAWNGHLKSDENGTEMVRAIGSHNIEAYRETSEEKFWRKNGALVIQNKESGRYRVMEADRSLHKYSDYSQFDDSSFDIMSWHDGVDRRDLYPENHPTEKSGGPWSWLFG